MALTGFAAASGDHPPQRKSAEQTSPERARVIHRLVWAEDTKGMRNLSVRSSRLDGGDVREIYDYPRGFTLTLVPDSAGRRVAFATCCSDDIPQLVVVPVLGGTPIEPLAEHPELTAVDGIGWSPDGRSLAFEAITERDGQRLTSIWTVRLNGSDLREVLVLGEVLPEDSPTLRERVVWTDQGILYAEQGDLYLASEQTSRRVMRGVGSVVPSGDRRWLLLTRYRNGRNQLWIARPDGSRARKVAQWDLEGETRYWEMTPNHDASRILALRSVDSDYSSAPDWVVWDTKKGPASAEVLPVEANVLAWN